MYNLTDFLNIYFLISILQVYTQYFRLSWQLPDMQHGRRQDVLLIPLSKRDGTQVIIEWALNNEINEQKFITRSERETFLLSKWDRRERREERKIFLSRWEGSRRKEEGKIFCI